MCSRVMVAASALMLATTLGCSAASPPVAPKAKPEAARAEKKASSPRSWVEVLRRNDAAEEAPGEPGAQAKISAPVVAHEVRHERERSAASVLKALTQPGVVFMVEYRLTDAYQRALANCTAVVGEDEDKKAECASKAREKFAADVIRFREDDEGQLWWLTYRRKGEDLEETHSVKVELDASAPQSVTMTTLGPGKGKRPLFKGATRIVMGVPNEYSIELNDPELGQLVYDAKIGLVR